MNKARRNAILLLMLTAVLWSTGGVLIKWIDWPAPAIAGMRSAIAAVFLWLLVRRPRFTWSRVQLGGAIAYAVTVMLFVMATKLTTATNAIMLIYTSPIYVALFSGWFLGEPVQRRDWLTLWVVVGGMGLFFVDSLTLDGWWGNFCAMLGGLSSAWIVLCLRQQHRESPLETVILGNLLAALMGMPFMFHSMPEASSWVALGLAGAVQIGLAFVFYIKAIRHVSALEASLIPAIEPLLNPLWVWLLIHEMPGSWALVGGSIVLIAVTVRGFLTSSQPPSSLPAAPLTQG